MFGICVLCSFFQFLNSILCYFSSERISSRHSIFLSARASLFFVLVFCILQTNSENGGLIATVAWIGVGKSDVSVPGIGTFNQVLRVLSLSFGFQNRILSLSFGFQNWVWVRVWVFPSLVRRCVLCSHIKYTLWQ